MRLTLTILGHELLALTTSTPHHEPLTPDCWWTISGDTLLTALHQAHHGEDPGVVYAELYANSDHDTPDT